MLVALGANMELQPFPSSWNGVPPSGAQRITLSLAVGEGTAWELDGITYGKDLEPLMPWGKYSRRWKLSGDFNYDSPNPHIKHDPSGLIVPIVWVSNMPHITKENLEDLRLASKLSYYEAHRFQRHLNAGLRVLKTIMECKTGVLKEYAAGKVTEFILEQHRRGGHLKFMPECEECRKGAIRQRAHRRQDGGDKPGG